MFKKIFHTSAVSKTGEDSKASSISESSVSEESEIITASEIPKPEKRFFLRRPSRIKPPSEESPLSYFRTFDPFDIKSSLKRSSSFAFKSKLEDSDPSSLGIPRSKSVHFADNLTTYHEFKPSFGPEFDELESTFEEFCRLRRNEAEGETESEGEGEEGDEGREEEDSEDEEGKSPAYEEEKAENQKEIKTQEDQGKAQDITQTEDPKKDGPKKNIPGPLTETKRGMKLAGKHLQSVFGATISEPTFTEISKANAFDNSDSTDVESLTDGKKDKDVEFFYDLYEQLCDLRQIKAKDGSNFNVSQLKTEISCAIADIGDCLSDSRDQIEQSNKEVRKLRHTLQSASHEIDLQTAISRKLNSIAEQFKDSQDQFKEKDDQIKALEKKIVELEAANDSEIQNFIKTKRDLEDQLSNSQKEICELQKRIASTESLQTLNEFKRKEREELLHQLAQARKEAKDLQNFQEEEKSLLQEESNNIQNQNKTLEKQVYDKGVIIQQLEQTLKTHKAATQQQLNEANLMVQEIGKRNEEKKAQICKIIESLESIRFHPSAEGRNSPSQKEQPKKKPSLIDSKVPSPTPELDLVKEVIGNIHRGIANLKLKDQALTRKLDEISASNNIGVESLTTLIKGSFEVLTPIFHKDCAEQFTQMYYEITKSNVLNEQKKGVLMVLCNFLLNSQRELLQQHTKNEQMLETEIEDRLKYQQQVLDSFTRIVKQVMETNRPPRVSGIRGHSSPKKSKSATRNR